MLVLALVNPFFGYLKPGKALADECSNINGNFSMNGITYKYNDADKKTIYSEILEKGSNQSIVWQLSEEASKKHPTGEKFYIKKSSSKDYGLKDIYLSVSGDNVNGMYAYVKTMDNYTSGRNKYKNVMFFPPKDGNTFVKLDWNKYNIVVTDQAIYENTELLKALKSHISIFKYYNIAGFAQCTGITPISKFEEEGVIKLSGSQIIADNKPSVNLEWTYDKQEDSTKYQVWRKKENDQFKNIANDLARKSANTFIDKDVELGKTYQYYVKLSNTEKYKSDPPLEITISNNKDEIEKCAKYISDYKIIINDLNTATTNNNKLEIIDLGTKRDDLEQKIKNECPNDFKEKVDAVNTANLNVIKNANSKIFDEEQATKNDKDQCPMCFKEKLNDDPIKRMVCRAICWISVAMKNIISIGYDAFVKSLDTSNYQ